MTVYLRLLAGFTSFISKRCLSHFPWTGPSGMLERSSIGPSLGEQSREDGRGEREVSDRHHRGKGNRYAEAQAVVAGMVQAERLQHAPGAVVEVQPEREHGDDVEDRHRQDAQPADHVVVDVARDVV